MGTKGIQIVFGDGVVFPGRDATDVLRRLGTVQMAGPCNVEEMRRRIADRVWALARDNSLDPTMSDDEFVRALDATGIVRVEPLDPKALMMMWKDPR